MALSGIAATGSVEAVVKLRIVLFYCLLLPVVAQARPVCRPRDWWTTPGRLSAYDARWRAQYLRHKENADAYAAALLQHQKTGRGMSYLKQGGVSPSWYIAPLFVQPFPGEYSAKLYNLAYSVFLQSHRLKAAYRLAYTAVLQRPDDRRWRRRLIRVSLWLGQREQALTQWFWLAQHGDTAAVQKAVTLAVSLSRPDLVVRLLRPSARAATLSNAGWKSLIFAYGELGEPNKALADIDAALRRGGPRRYLLAQETYLSYQLGRINQSLAALQRRAQLYGSTPHIAVVEARLLSMQGRYRLAFQALERARASAGLNDVPFWKLYAILAWKIYNNRAALSAEKTLYLLGATSQYDLQRLVSLNGKRNAKAAMYIAKEGWEHYHLPLFYFEALYYAGVTQNWRQLGVLLQQVSTHDTNGIRRYPAYWMAVGQWADAEGDYALAGRAYARVLQLDPGDEVAESNLMWMLVDHYQTRVLRALLVDDALHPPPGLHNVFVDALERVGRDRAALDLSLRGDTRGQNPSGADLLRQAGLWATNGDPGLAWLQRRQAARLSVQELGRQPEFLGAERGRPTIRYASRRVRVSGPVARCDPSADPGSRFTADPAPADPVSSRHAGRAEQTGGKPDEVARSFLPGKVLRFSRQHLHTLAVSLSSLPSVGNVTPRVLWAEARRGHYLPAVSWAMAQGDWELAWFLLETNPRPDPAWAKLSLALHRPDNAELARLLQHPERLPVRGRVQAQMDLGRYDEARSDALAGMEGDPDDRRLRRDYLRAVRRSAGYLDFSGIWLHFNGLTLFGPRLRGRLALGNAWGILFDASDLHQSTTRSSQLQAVPDWSRREAVGFYWQRPRWAFQALIGEYQGVRNNPTFGLKAQWHMSGASELMATWQYHDRSLSSLQSPALMAAGMVNKYQLQWMDQVGSWIGDVGGGWRQYQGQDGVNLGTELVGEFSLFWRHGLGPWKLQLGPFVDYYGMHRSEQLVGVVAQSLVPGARNIGAVLPGSNSDIGVRLQWGRWERALHSHWTPYVVVLLYENTRFGFQYQFNTGFSTSVWGPDRLRIGFSQGQASNGLNINQQIFKVGYRLYF